MIDVESLSEVDQNEWIKMSSFSNQSFAFGSLTGNHPALDRRLRASMVFAGSREVAVATMEPLRNLSNQAFNHETVWNNSEEDYQRLFRAVREGWRLLGV